jgi:hypothetical protein
MVPPDGDVDLIYRLGGAGQTLVRGPQSRLTSISIDRFARYIGVRLATEAATRVTGLTAGELIDRRLPAAPINSELGDLLRRPAGGCESESIVGALVGMLRRQFADYGNPGAHSLASIAMHSFTEREEHHRWAPSRADWDVRNVIFVERWSPPLVFRPRNMPASFVFNMRCISSLERAGRSRRSRWTSPILIKRT